MQDTPVCKNIFLHDNPVHRTILYEGQFYWVREAHNLKIEESYKCMLKVELITNLRGAYYRVDLRIERFFSTEQMWRHLLLKK